MSPPADMAASVKARLLNLRTTSGRPGLPGDYAGWHQRAGKRGC